MKTIRLFSVLFLCAGVLALSGCNTIEGLGRDARAAGDAVTGAAHSAKGY